MALLVDKHRPRSLEALSYHADLSERLRSLVRSLFWLTLNLLLRLLRDGQHSKSSRRRKAVTSRTFSSTVPRVPERRHVSSQPSKSSTAPVSRKSRSMRASSKPHPTANSSSTSLPPFTILRSHPLMLGIMTVSSCRICSRRSRRRSRST